MRSKCIKPHYKLTLLRLFVGVVGLTVLGCDAKWIDPNNEDIKFSDTPYTQGDGRAVYAPPLLDSCSEQVWKEMPRINVALISTVPQLPETMTKMEQARLVSQKTQLVCLDGLFIEHSSTSKTPLWVAEHLTEERIKQAKQLPRIDAFHEEPSLSEKDRSWLRDYKRQPNYDRGHMAPNADMATRQQQWSAFSLANMVPQQRYNNQEPWRKLEEAVRVLPRKFDDIYVITGPLFLTANLSFNGKVAVPTHLYKVIYIPKLQLTSAYVAPNDGSGRVSVLSINQLQSLAQIDFLPRVEARFKSSVINLPLTSKQAYRVKLRSFKATDIESSFFELKDLDRDPRSKYDPKPVGN